MVIFVFLYLCDNSHLYDGGLLDNYTPNRTHFFWCRFIRDEEENLHDGSTKHNSTLYV